VTEKCLKLEAFFGGGELFRALLFFAAGVQVPEGWKYFTAFQLRFPVIFIKKIVQYWKKQASGDIVYL
jgi:hypothetical protein